MELNAAFGDLVRQRRKELQLTQEAVAELSGLSRNYVNELENGKYNVTLNTLVKVAQALEIDPAKLLEGLTANLRRK